MFKSAFAFVALLSFASPVWANVLLSCTLEGGDITELTLSEAGGQLNLKEVDTKRIVHNRIVTQQEWDAKKLTLTVLGKDANSNLTFDRQARVWWFSYHSGNWNESGPVSCD